MMFSPSGCYIVPNVPASVRPLYSFPSLPSRWQSIRPYALQHTRSASNTRSPARGKTGILEPWSLVKTHTAYTLPRCNQRQQPVPVRARRRESPTPQFIAVFRARCVPSYRAACCEVWDCGACCCGGGSGNDSGGGRDDDSGGDDSDGGGGSYDDNGDGSVNGRTFSIRRGLPETPAYPATMPPAAAAAAAAVAKSSPRPLQATSLQRLPWVLCSNFPGV